VDASLDLTVEFGAIELGDPASQLNILRSRSALKSGSCPNFSTFVERANRKSD
jgi:hypothetical protein